MRAHRAGLYVLAWFSQLLLFVSLTVAVAVGVLLSLPLLAENENIENALTDKINEMLPGLQVTYGVLKVYPLLDKVYVQLEDIVVAQEGTVLAKMPYGGVWYDEEKWQVKVRGAQLNFSPLALSEAFAQSSQSSNNDEEATAVGGIDGTQQIFLLMENTQWHDPESQLQLNDADIKAQLADNRWQVAVSEKNHNDRWLNAHASGQWHTLFPIEIKATFKNFIPPALLPLTWQNMQATVAVALNQTIDFSATGKAQSVVIEDTTIENGQWKISGQLVPNVTAWASVWLRTQSVESSLFTLPQSNVLSLSVVSGGQLEEPLSALSASYALLADQLALTSTVISATVSVFSQGDFAVADKSWYWLANQLYVANDDFAVKGSLVADGIALSVSQITVHADIGYANLAQLHHYMPAGELRQYFTDNVLQGAVNHGAFYYQQNALLTSTLLTAVFSGGELIIDDNWPLAQGLLGVIVLNDNKLHIDGEGRFNHVYADNVLAVIDDVHANHPTLALSIDVGWGVVSNYMQAAAAVPPIKEGVGVAQTFMLPSAAGVAKLTLAITVPINDPDNTQVLASLLVGDITVQADKQLPNIAVEIGNIVFSNQQFTGNLQGAFDGDTTQPVAATFDDAQNLEATGKLNSPAVISLLHFSTPPLSGHLEFNLSADISLTVVHADLSNMAFLLPVPLSKTIGDVASLSLRLSEQQLQAGLTAPNLNLLLITNTAGFQVAVNREPLEVPSVGNVIHGTLANVDIDQWLQTIEQHGVGFNQLSLFIADAKFAGLALPQLNVSVTRGEAGTNIAVKESPTINGEIYFDDSNLVVSLAHLHLPMKVKTGDNNKNFLANRAVSVTVDELQLGGLTLGQLKIQGAPQTTGWHLNSLVIYQGVTTLSVGGVSQNNTTYISLILDTDSFDELLTITDIPPVISDGRISVGGNLSWTGEILDFALPVLHGTLTLNGHGLNYADISFTSEVIGLLSKLSPESLFKLGLRDLSQKDEDDDATTPAPSGIGSIGKPGVSFNEVTGNLVVANGYVYLAPMMLASDNIELDLLGKTNFVQQEHHLYGRVRPGRQIVKAGSAATLGLPFDPVSFFSALILGKIFEEPISQLGAYNYTITGAWQDPHYAEHRETTTTQTN